MASTERTVRKKRIDRNLMEAGWLPILPCRIVARLQDLLAQAEAIERATTAAQARLARLDQAVLARAFRGEL